MPIGFDRGELGGGEEAAAEGEGERGVWAWVEIVRRTLIPEVWTRWTTVEDERVCPECGPLDGLVWPAGEGPTPPLHVSCRCRRVYAFTQWRVRALTEPVLRWVDG